MHLTRELMNRWAHRATAGPHVLVLAEGDSMVSHDRASERSPVIAGPAVVEIARYRDGGWSARKLPTLTPANIQEAAR